MIDATAIADAEFSKAKPYSVQHWLERDLPPLDPLLGDAFTTTSRLLLVGGTGIGKTSIMMAMGWAMARGDSFVHWSGRRPATGVLYIDGEMSARVLRSRIRDAAERHGSAPANMHFINRDDFQNMPPLNTAEGQTFMDGLIGKYTGTEFIFFDNIQALLLGDMKDEVPWSEVLPWVRTLTRRGIGQAWGHHTGHDATKSYGSKAREWQMDSVILMTDRADKGELLVDFDLSFTKARERNRDNRADFADARIWINAEDRWESSTVPAAGKQKARRALRPEDLKPLDYLRDVLVEHGATVSRPTMPRGCKAVKVDEWREELKRRGLHEGGDSGKKWFQRMRERLVAFEKIAIDEPYVWLVGKS